MATTEVPTLQSQEKRSRSRQQWPGKPSLWVGLLAWAIGILFVTPVAWMVLTGFHSEVNAAKNPPSLLAPLTTDGWANVFGLTGGQSAVPALLNSTVAAVGSTLLVLVLAIPAAYATGIKPIRKTKDVMSFFLSTKFLPVVAGLLPLYLFAKNIGALDSVGILVILYTSMNLAIAVWMLRSFFIEVPVALVEAAQLDGAGLFRILRSVIVPITMPGIAATALICMIFSWNELLLARTLTGPLAGTAPVFLAGFVTSQGLFLGQLSAACTIISLPVLVAGFAAQDRLVTGLSFGAVK